MAGCDGICDGLPGVAQPSICKEVIIKKTAVIYTTKAALKFKPEKIQA